MNQILEKYQGYKSVINLFKPHKTQFNTEGKSDNIQVSDDKLVATKVNSEGLEYILCNPPIQTGDEGIQTLACMKVNVTQNSNIEFGIKRDLDEDEHSFMLKLADGKI